MCRNNLGGEKDTALGQTPSAQCTYQKETSIYVKGSLLKEGVDLLLDLQKTMSMCKYKPREAHGRYPACLIHASTSCTCLCISNPLADTDCANLRHDWKRSSGVWWEGKENPLHMVFTLWVISFTCCFVSYLSNKIDNLCRKLDSFRVKGPDSFLVANCIASLKLVRSWSALQVLEICPTVKQVALI